MLVTHSLNHLYCVMHMPANKLANKQTGLAWLQYLMIEDLGPLDIRGTVHPPKSQSGILSSWQGRCCSQVPVALVHYSSTGNLGNSLCRKWFCRKDLTCSFQVSGRIFFVLILKIPLLPFALLCLYIWRLNCFRWSLQLLQELWSIDRAAFSIANTVCSVLLMQTSACLAAFSIANTVCNVLLMQSSACLEQHLPYFTPGG